MPIQRMFPSIYNTETLRLSAFIEPIYRTVFGCQYCLSWNGRVRPIYVHVFFYFLTSLSDWSTPRIDVSIITNNRPRSLERLLSSLSNGFFFGDTLNIRVNLEQSSDVETMRIAENLSWEHGVVFVHHRVVHGGLLPAVVESWYPQSSDTYGLLLEDDIELSPLFYAWIKMTILRYR